VQESVAQRNGLRTGPGEARSLVALDREKPAATSRRAKYGQWLCFLVAAWGPDSYRGKEAAKNTKELP